MINSKFKKLSLFIFAVSFLANLPFNLIGTPEEAFEILKNDLSNLIAFLKDERRKRLELKVNNWLDNVTDPEKGFYYNRDYRFKDLREDEDISNEICRKKSIVQEAEKVFTTEEIKSWEKDRGKIMADSRSEDDINKKNSEQGYLIFDAEDPDGGYSWTFPDTIFHAYDHLGSEELIRGKVEEIVRIYITPPSE